MASNQAPTGQAGQSSAAAPHVNSGPTRPSEQPLQPGPSSGVGQKKKKKHRAGKKRRDRRKSFAAPSVETEGTDLEHEEMPAIPEAPSASVARQSFYRISRGGRSNTSLESEALLDHRDQAPLRKRRQSINPLGTPRSSNFSSTERVPHSTANVSAPPGRSKLSRIFGLGGDHSAEEDDNDATDRTPLMSSSYRERPGSGHKRSGYGGFGDHAGSSSAVHRLRRPSMSSSSSRRRARQASQDNREDYDVNNPPSIPTTPKFGPENIFDDVMLTEDLDIDRSPDYRRSGSRDMLIDIDQPSDNHGSPYNESTPPSPGFTGELDAAGLRRRPTVVHPVEQDVCFPQEGLSEIGDYERHDETPTRHRRRRGRQWPELSALEEWSIGEKEEQVLEGLKGARKVSEPLLVGGRLRPQKHMWHREMDDAPYRFTYFNQDFQSTIHSQTISELLQPDQSFRDLFIPEPPLLDDSSDDEDDPPSNEHGFDRKQSHSTLDPHAGNGSVKQPDRKGTLSGQSTSGHNTPTPGSAEKPKRYGPRPVFWLDVLNPTDSEMKVLAKTFGIHPLTSEDIMMEEAREKVELFRNYYFVNYRTFEQDSNSEDYLEPVNMYVVVFREGVVSFHFSMTPHPANVRRRIRQLSDYLYLTTDWISYALIDDITDAYAPMIERIEKEVDEIDDSILRQHDANDASMPKKEYKAEKEKQSDAGGDTEFDGGDMLRHVGECRKRVMSLYRLLGNKADVIKGFAKRCTEQWDVAPKSEIGLYLGDIQDHIVTMTANLSHYENLLSRAHSNYLALINIRMNERAEATNDVLGKLTVLGTIVLPMNIITGMWGMNVKVPGQVDEVDSMTWFWCITAGLITFGLVCYTVAKRTLHVV